MTSYKPATLPKFFKINLQESPTFNQHVPSPTRRTRSTAGSGTGRARVTKDHHERKRHNHACTQATEKRKLAVQISNLKFWTAHAGASRPASEQPGCLSRLRSEETGLLDQKRSRSREKYLLWADTRDRMRAGLQGKTLEPTEA